MVHSHKDSEKYIEKIEGEYSTLEKSYADLLEKYNELVKQTNDDMDLVVKTMVEAEVHAAKAVSSVKAEAAGIINETRSELRALQNETVWLNQKISKTINRIESIEKIKEPQVRYPLPEEFTEVLSKMICQAGDSKTVKTLEQLTAEYNEENPSALRPEKKKRFGISKKAIFVLLFGALVFALLAAVFLSGNSNDKYNFMGYSWFTVVSESMQSEIPYGSLVIVQKTDEGEIKIGDDITFIRKADETAVTHRVINIYEKYGEQGDRGFQTWGIDNAEPDHEIIHSGDIVGVVKFIIPGLGNVLHQIAVIIGVFLVLFGGIIIISVATKKRFNKKENDSREQSIGNKK